MRTTLPALASLLALVACDTAAKAPVAVESARVRLPAVPGRPGAGYFAITARAADVLTAVSSPRAERIELHESMTEGGMVHMAPIARLPLPPGGTVTFAPGGKHLMLFGLHPALKAGGTVPLTFAFAKAAPLIVEAKLVAPGSEPVD